MCWIRHDTEIRRQYLADVLARIRMPLLKPSFLTDRVAGDEIIRLEAIFEK